MHKIEARNAGGIRILTIGEAVQIASVTVRSLSGVIFHHQILQFAVQSAAGNAGNSSAAGQGCQLFVGSVVGSVESLSVGRQTSSNYATLAPVLDYCPNPEL